ncbi:bifunctional diguanylate cyclase/phosphodiesterase [Sulfurimonas sp.]|jgi:diguanylate cyclase|uniref:putative bifunctional diguanylate cyclase/phosphodiesterase n=1 Tax=Sulfurimonas sp. TaxID=2022749 RepID=UPI0025F07390|nr:bifunctional diguanylate cyclase/phosphodiesterase [Sulfurimonas sp.]MBT5934279.1 bifunctional diguanylate cyclase/phosphodiesterase [Sulfurimonas sp.]
MNQTMSFYKFMHKQIIVMLLLHMGTAPGYLLMGYFYTSMVYESVWMLIMFIISVYGYVLYKQFNIKMTINDKQMWLTKVRLFMYIYSVSWIFMFVYYTSFENVEMHYITIATELGVAVVAATLLASQKNLVSFTVITLMIPLVVYFLIVGGTYAYILAFFSTVLAAVIIYSARNTNDYISKSSYQAYHDHLTDIGNRRYFLEILDSTVREQKEKYSYLLLIDLDHFKTINDTLGHDIGDELLVEVANRMKILSRENGSTLSRLGGDEFCILSTPLNDKLECTYQAEFFAKELLTAIRKTYILDGNNLHISASIGASIVDGKEVDVAEFLKEADMAMYEAKNAGRDGVIAFDESLSAVVHKKLEVERLLHFALEENEITLNYQAQVDKQKKIIGCEVLVRWNNELLGNIGPDFFIPIAENTGYIIELGTYILEESFKSIQEWNSRKLDIKQVSINISIRQLLHQDFASVVEELLTKYIDEDSTIDIVFEITETGTADDLKQLVQTINKVKEYGIVFSMDDFGTGYSSLSYLREIPIDELKIDKSFIFGLGDKQQALLVKTIIDIAKNLELIIVAEGVEEEYHREFLLDLDCDLYQGYLFHKPLPKNEFEALLLARELLLVQ